MTDKELLQQALVWFDDKEGEYTDEFQNFIDAIRTRLAQPEKEWVWLTDKEVKQLSDYCVDVRDEIEFIRAIEEEIKEKNNG
jgi:hypothetical protein